MVRESSGVLRDATWEEQDCMMQVYFPSLGKKMWLPHMLTEEGLIPVLEAGWYKDVLDMACLQCEPDSADYIRVSVKNDCYTVMYAGMLVSVPYFKVELCKKTNRAFHQVYARCEIKYWRLYSLS